MLTRLEVDGFKNLLGFQAEFGPFTCIAGPNGAGKSNVFDVIEFLSLLADHPIMEAAERIRGTDDRAVDPEDLFWTDGSSRAEHIRIAAEMLVPEFVEDDFGRQAKATTTFLRYEIRLGYEPPDGENYVGRLQLLWEELSYIKLGDAHKHLRWHHSKAAFRDKVVRGRRSGAAFISTVRADDGQLTIQVHQDGGSRGKPRPSAAMNAPRTIVSTTTTSSDPTILAARREFQSWRLLALEPRAMRSPDPFRAPSEVSATGAHLAATLHRLATQDAEGEDAYSTVAARAADLIDVHSLRVDRDQKRELFTLELKQTRGGFLPARALSDGTLRFLALCILGADPHARGLICMEEPENGIHPAKMSAMVNLLRELCVDPTRRPGLDNPLRQIIVNTHSPPVVQLQNARDLVLAKSVSVRRSDGQLSRTMRLLPMAGQWRCSEEEPGIMYSDIVAYLATAEGMQIEFPFQVT